MKEIDKEKAIKIMENYENVMIVDNSFSDDMMALYFRQSLLEYADDMVLEKKQLWRDFKKLVNSGEIDWSMSGLNYKIYLQETTLISVIMEILKSSYSWVITIDTGEWPIENQEKMIVDSAWMIYTKNNLAEVENCFKYMSKKLNENIFKKIEFDDLKELVEGISNFNEEDIRLWIKLK
jgi:hypothetical protein